MLSYSRAPFSDLASSPFPWARVMLEHRLLRASRVTSRLTRRVLGPSASSGLMDGDVEDLRSSTYDGSGSVRLAGPLQDASGFKLAFLMPGPLPSPTDDETGPVLDGVHYAGLFHGTYVTSMDASCSRTPSHRPPVDGCSCGFHAFYTPARARAHWPWHPDAAILTVELYGDLVAHEHGWRAARQVVTGVFFRPRCVVCSSRPDGLAVLPPPHRGVLADTIGPVRFAPVCRSCSPLARPLSHLASDLGTEVSWAW